MIPITSPRSEAKLAKKIISLIFETVINHLYEFKIRRQGRRKGELVTGWFPMTKGISQLYRYAEVSLTANCRYLDALATVDDPALARRVMRKMVEPVRHISR